MQKLTYELVSSLIIHLELTFCCSAMRCNFEGCDYENNRPRTVECHFIGMQSVATLSVVVCLLTRSISLQCSRAPLRMRTHNAGPPWEGIPVQSYLRVGCFAVCSSGACAR